MKKTLSLLLVCVLLVGCIFSLASCGKTLSGTYKADVVVGGTSYTFSGSKVTLTAEVLGFEKSFEGTYEIAENDAGKLQITFTFGEDADSKYSGSFDFAEGKEGETEYIKIGIVKYVKQK